MSSECEGEEEKAKGAIKKKGESNDMTSNTINYHVENVISVKHCVKWCFNLYCIRFSYSRDAEKCQTDITGEADIHHG